MRPPLSNLGPMSEPWARWQTDQTIQNATAIEQLGGDASNDGRINNSAFDNLAGQIKELNARQSWTVFGSTMTTPAFDQSGTTVSVSSNIQLPQPVDTARIGWVSLSATPSLSNTQDSTVFVTFSVDGRVFYRSSIALPPGPTPAGWTGFSFQGATGFTARPGSGGLLSILYEARGLSFSSGARLAYLSGISATVAYSQKV